MQSFNMSFQPSAFRLPTPAVMRFPSVQMTPPSLSAPLSLNLAPMLRAGFLPSGTPGAGTALLREQAFSPMKEEALTTALSMMKTPLTKENVALAKSMVQSGVPLTKENMADLKASLSSLPTNGSGTMQAASFLKSAALPLTSQNITLLSNFIAANPYIGACIFEFNKEFKKLRDGGKFQISAERMGILSKASSMLGEMVMNSKAGLGANVKAFRKTAGNSGMELPNFMMGARNEEFDSLMQALRKILFSDKNSAAEAMKNAFLKLDEALLAQRLINGAKREGLDNFYYFQLPLVFGDSELTAEFKVFYTTDYTGRQYVDPDNFEFEFIVPSIHIGNVHFKGTVSSGIVNIAAGFASQQLCAFAEKFMPILLDRLQEVGFTSGNYSVFLSSENPLMAIDGDDFAEMESVDMSF